MENKKVSVGFSHYDGDEYYTLLLGTSGWAELPPKNSQLARVIDSEAIKNHQRMGFVSSAEYKVFGADIIEQLSIKITGADGVRKLLEDLSEEIDLRYSLGLQLICLQARDFQESYQSKLAKAGL